MDTKTGRRTTGWKTDQAPNSFDRTGAGKDGTEAGQKRPGYHEVTTAQVTVKGAKGREVIETIIPRSGRAD